MQKLKLGLVTLLTALALCLGFAGPAAADPGTSGDELCTSGTFTGGVNDGSWSRNYNPGCNNNTIATVSVEWHNYVGSGGDHHITWKATLSTNQIGGSKCVEIALDFANPTGAHEDAQFLRNCKENSSISLDNLNGTQDINVFQAGFNVNWPMNRVQLGTYNPNNCDATTCEVSNVVCPSANGAPPGTIGDTGCSQWLNLNGGAAQWDSRGAKIYRRTNAGTAQQNIPYWPADYGLTELKNPNI
jgi:hypothetical protein